VDRSNRAARLACVVLAALAASGCGRLEYQEQSVGLDGAAIDDSGARDGASDAGEVDAGSLDAGSLDAGTLDASSFDASSFDAGIALDAPSIDAWLPPSTVVQLATARSTTCVRLASGTVQCVGENASGLLGTGSLADPDTTRLAPVVGLSGVTYLRGHDNTMCAASGGTTYCWGSNIGGSLGIGSASPTELATPTAATALGAGTVVPSSESTCVVDPGGTVRCVGANFYGQLGDGTTADSATARTVLGLGGVQSLAAGAEHYCARETGGQVSCWGWGSAGQLGDRSTVNRSSPVRAAGIRDAIAVGAGAEHTCAIHADRTLSCWGAGGNGQLGDGTTANRDTPGIVPGLADVVQVTGGYSHTCALLGDGRIFCFGSNGYGQIGDGTTMGRTTPTLVLAPADAIAIASVSGLATTCSIHADGTARCWGYNFGGNLGDGTTTNSSLPVVMLPPS
jgi:alpha-tubulin suppressor-like RCC1 family protein